MSEWGEVGEGALTRRRKNRLLPSRGQRGSSILMWFLRGRLPNNSKLHRSQLEVLIKCLSEVEVERERGQLAEKPKPDSGSQEVRGIAEAGTKCCYVSDTVTLCCRVCVLPLLCLKQPPTGLHKTCHYVTQSIMLSKTASHFHRGVTYDYFPLDSQPEMTHGCRVKKCVWLAW